MVNPGDTVIEVGANIGGHTVGLAKRVGPQGLVIAFEPQRGCFSLLQSQIALNELGGESDVNSLIHLHERQSQVEFAPKG